MKWITPKHEWQCMAFYHILHKISQGCRTLNRIPKLFFITHIQHLAQKGLCPKWLEAITLLKLWSPLEWTRIVFSFSSSYSTTMIKEQVDTEHCKKQQTKWKLALNKLKSQMKFVEKLPEDSWATVNHGQLFRVGLPSLLKHPWDSIILVMAIPFMLGSINASVILVMVIPPNQENEAIVQYIISNFFHNINHY